MACKTPPRHPNTMYKTSQQPTYPDTTHKTPPPTCRHAISTWYAMPHHHRPPRHCQSTAMPPQHGTQDYTTRLLTAMLPWRVGLCHRLPATLPHPDTDSRPHHRPPATPPQPGAQDPAVANQSSQYLNTDANPVTAHPPCHHNTVRKTPPSPP
ncbi:hypothetical protein EDB83DRAFT_2523388 [Lactarius deliciosus]|nr:hypothetical protein EDB83DRAFT_2523388 [Lactarius deliciosus]